VDLDLSPVEVRVLGSLVEKELTTPEQYPLTLNALVLACNQKSSRDPVVRYDDKTVETAVTSSKTKGLARFVHPSHGRSAIRYAHLLGEALGVSERQLALLSVLMLRGPQTPGELRTRTDRMAEFGDLPDLERELERLCGLDEPLVERLSRRPGQSQDRYRQLLGGESEAGRYDDRSLSPAPSPAYRGEASSGYGSATSSGNTQAPMGNARSLEIAELRAELEDLRETVSQLREELADLRGQLGG
jgi:uncharacterized protein